ncbi:arylamine N-acetyltransferase family protein [Nocardia transvalensis]|uniref:arylamine N-acetyltransferase family protein n=1 Tax=Nocardia transvalensis TaxID=37333 RepID=UPI0018948677|nr:arylamine N-acetyltransferase [Nocardia transvalensis]MBF6329707.1 arylamine N-acetyltransferase [Nocardia transvalensis]
MDHDLVLEYLRRIGVKGPVRPDIDTLRELHRRHLEAVPFENLSIHLGERIVLDEKLLVDKIVLRRRGGFCYELNGAFGALLSSLGYRATRLASGVFDDGHVRPPFDHLVVRVDLDRPWLVDVGFGRNARYPLRLDSTDEQPDPDGVFRVVPVDDGSGDLDLLCDGQRLYRIETRPRRLIDFEPFCWYHQTSPDSPFTGDLVCSRATPTGRITLSDRTLTRTENGQQAKQTLTDDETSAAYRELFGIELDRLPVVAKPR